MSQNGAAPKANAVPAPRSTAIPPVRGTGRSCSERSFGSSSANWPKREQDPHRQERNNERQNRQTRQHLSDSSDCDTTAPWRADLPPSRTGPPAELIPDRRIVHLERAGEPFDRQQGRRKRKQACRPAERMTDGPAKLRRRQRLAVGDVEGPPPRPATRRKPRWRRKDSPRTRGCVGCRCLRGAAASLALSRASARGSWPVPAARRRGAAER